MKSFKKINFTIAVMIYNVESFLCECIDSCIRQEGDDIEILLIDDGSTDKSGEICNEYAQKDSRITVFHKKNAGVSTARNMAIKEAKGKWLILVDGDDLLTDKAIEFGRKYVDDKSELLQFDAVPFSNNLSLSDWKPKGEEMVVTGDKLKEYHIQLIDRSSVNMVFPTYNLNPAWAKMWNIEFIKKNNLLYNEKVHKGEGTLFTFTASYKIKQVRIIPYVLYGYRLNPKSIMRRFSEDILENQNMQWLQYYKVISDNNEIGDEVINEALNRRGLYLIENAIYLGIAHPNCKWNYHKKLEWATQLCNFEWVIRAVDYAERNGKINKINKLIRAHNTKAIVGYCDLLKYKQLLSKKLKHHKSNQNR